MNILKIVSLILLIPFGIFMVVFGEGDDSPGAQMIGLIAVILGVYGIIKSRRKAS